MSEGDGMAEVTEGDREKAWLVLSALPISIPNYSPETVRKAQDHLAAALAEEREKARAPFLAEIATTEAIAAQLEHSDKYWNGWIDAAENIITRFRRAAEETP